MLLCVASRWFGLFPDSPSLSQAIHQQQTCLWYKTPNAECGIRLITCACLPAALRPGLHQALLLDLTRFFSLRRPREGLFMARAEAGRHCTVQSITPPWTGCSGPMHLKNLGACVALPHVCPSSTTINCTLVKNRYVPICLIHQTRLS